MDELLKRLETQIRELIDRQDKLQRTNQQLHRGQFHLSREKQALQEKQQNTINTIEGLVSRLKALEGQS